MAPAQSKKKKMKGKDTLSSTKSKTNSIKKENAPSKGKKQQMTSSDDKEEEDGNAQTLLGKEGDQNTGQANQNGSGQTKRKKKSNVDSSSNSNSKGSSNSHNDKQKEVKRSSSSAAAGKQRGKKSTTSTKTQDKQADSEQKKEQEKSLDGRTNSSKGSKRKRVEKPSVAEKGEKTTKNPKTTSAQSGMDSRDTETKSENTNMKMKTKMKTDANTNTNTNTLSQANTKKKEENEEDEEDEEEDEEDEAEEVETGDKDGKAEKDEKEVIQEQNRKEESEEDEEDEEEVEYDESWQYFHGAIPSLDNEVVKELDVIMFGNEESKGVTEAELVHRCKSVGVDDAREYLSYRSKHYYILYADATREYYAVNEAFREKWKNLKEVKQYQVFEIIRQAGQEGIWQSDIRDRLQYLTNEPQPDIAKIIKRLGHLVKPVKSAIAKNKRFYMISVFPPLRKHTGGPFFQGGKLNVGSTSATRRYIENRTVTHELSIPNVTRYLNRSSHFVNDKLEISDVEEIVGALKYEDMIRDKYRYNPMSHQLELVQYEGYPGLEPTPLARIGQCADGSTTTASSDSVFRDQGIASRNYMSSVSPCGRCRVADQCTLNGIISPRNCPHLYRFSRGLHPDETLLDGVPDEDLSFYY